jgi:putative ABC transport system ATP-binding protein
VRIDELHGELYGGGSSGGTAVEVAPTTEALVARTPVIEVEDLGKIYGLGESQVEALAGVNLSVEAGEWVSLIGPSGSGKSTLMNLLGLLDRPTSGSYSLSGREVSGLKGSELSRARRELVGFVFQSYNLLARETALDNVAMPMIYAGVGSKERRRRATEALERVGLSGRAKHRPPELSGGQMQRVAIARALINEPSLLLADEPTGNLDSISGEAIMELFRELHGSGVAIMVVTHETDIAEQGDRTIEIHDGRLFDDNGRNEDNENS